MSASTMTMEKANKIAQARIAELEAARFAYASEFDGDTGSIHENIRKMKAENAKLREGIKTHKESFLGDAGDIVPEDDALWALLEGKQ